MIVTHNPLSLQSHYNNRLIHMLIQNHFLHKKQALLVSSTYILPQHDLVYSNMQSNHHLKTNYEHYNFLYMVF